MDTFPRTGTSAAQDLRKTPGECDVEVVGRRTWGDKGISEVSSVLMSEDRLSTTTAMNFGIKAVTID